MKSEANVDDLTDMQNLERIGLGGGCHWCTEAVFQQLKGVHRVEQGYISSAGDNTSFSEGVVVHFDPGVVSLELLIEVHLATHESSSNHSFRDKYRSAIYFFDRDQETISVKHLGQLQKDKEETIVTRILPFSEFKPSRESLQNYYKRNPEAPFCSRYIVPKIQKIQKNYSDHI